MNQIFKVAKYQKSETGFNKIGYDEYVITYYPSKKSHLLRIVVNGRLTNSTINLMVGNCGYRKSILKAISDYKNNRLKTSTDLISKKIITLHYLKSVFSKNIINNVNNYLICINKEDSRDVLTEYELI